MASSHLKREYEIFISIHKIVILLKKTRNSWFDSYDDVFQFNLGESLLYQLTTDFEMVKLKCQKRRITKGVDLS